MFGCLIDVLYVVWIHTVNINRQHLASLATVGIAACSSLGFLDIVDNRWLLIPYLSGIYTGTLLGVWIKKRFLKG